MRTLPLVSVLFALLVAPAFAQKRAAAPKEPTFAEAVDQAKKAVDSEDFGAAVSALQAAIREVQKKQRMAILVALPKPEGFTIKDEDAPDAANNPFGATMAAMGMSITRHYQGKGEQRLDVEVTANSPMVSMLSMVMTNPALAQADGAEIVEYGTHKALLKKQGDGDHELTILMHNKHLVKVTARGMTAEALLAVFDQATIDRLEKPLGK